MKCTLAVKLSQDAGARAAEQKMKVGVGERGGVGKGGGGLPVSQPTTTSSR